MCEGRLDTEGYEGGMPHFETVLDSTHVSSVRWPASIGWGVLHTELELRRMVDVMSKGVHKHGDVCE